MRSFIGSLIVGMILVASVLTYAGDHNKKGVKATVPVDAGDRIRPDRDQRDPLGPLGGFFIQNGRHLGSFFLGVENPADCHYTFSYDSEAPFQYQYFMLHEKLECLGFDKTGEYWQFRAIRTGEPLPGYHLPKYWYLSKDFNEDGHVWYQTDEPRTEPVFFGTAVEHFFTLRCRVGK